MHQENYQLGKFKLTTWLSRWRWLMIKMNYMLNTTNNEMPKETSMSTVNQWKSVSHAHLHCNNNANNKNQEIATKENFWRQHVIEPVMRSHLCYFPLQFHVFISQETSPNIALLSQLPNCIPVQNLQGNDSAMHGGLWFESIHMKTVTHEYV